MTNGSFISRFLYKEEGVLRPRGIRILFLMQNIYLVVFMIFLLFAFFPFFYSGPFNYKNFLTDLVGGVLFLFLTIITAKFTHSHIFRLSDLEEIIRNSGGLFVSVTEPKYRNLIRYKNILLYTDMSYRSSINVYAGDNSQYNYFHFYKNYKSKYPALFFKIHKENPLRLAYDLDWYGFVIPGDFINLKKVRFALTGNTEYSPKGNEAFDNAMTNLIDNIGDDHPGYHIEIKEEYIRVSFWRSAIQGKILGKRITKSIELFQKFAEDLSRHFMLFPSDTVTIDLKFRSEYEVKKIESSEQASIG